MPDSSLMEKLTNAVTEGGVEPAKQLALKLSTVINTPASRVDLAAKTNVSLFFM